MAETVGTKTKQKTSVGKDVYKTPEGESVSEKSVTIKFGDEAYVNAPSIHEGKQYTEDEIKEMLLEGVIKPTSRHDTLEEAVKAAETRSDNLLKDGGMTLAKQMEMFQDGGLMDEGGTVDPVSGNDVPPGSNQEEVRDDIPAQLSEGEFVFPADVVRYFGLEKLMEMRQEAKMGLQRMEDMGQMGNSEEAIMPDNLPFDVDDIDMEDDGEPQEFNLGGIVQQPGTGIAGYTAPSMLTTGYTPPPVGTAIAPVVPGSQPRVAFTPATASTNIPTFGQFVGTGGGKYDELVTYVNDAGQIMRIPHINGKPIYPVPEGFKKQEKPTDAALIDTTKVSPTQSQFDDNGRDSGDNEEPGPSTTDVTGIGYDRSKLDPAIRDLVDKYGAGFGTLMDTFVKGPFQAIPGPMDLLGKPDPTTKNNALTSAAFGGIVDSFRGITGSQFSRETAAGAIMAGLDNYQNKKGFDNLTAAEVERLSVNTPVVMASLQSLFQTEDGKAISQEKAMQNVKAEAAKYGVETRLNQYQDRNLTAIIREIAMKKELEAEKARKDRNEKAAVQKAEQAIANFNKQQGTKTDIEGLGVQDRSRDATFGGDGSDMAPGSVTDRAEAEAASADLGIFGP